MAKIIDDGKIIQDDALMMKNVLINDKGYNNVVCFADISSFDGGNDEIHITFEGNNNKIYFGKNVGIHRGLKIAIYRGEVHFAVIIVKL